MHKSRELPCSQTVACSFKSFGLHPSVLKAVEEAKFERPTPVQEKVIPHIMSGSDVVAQAQTGTGKTAAFGLPALHLLAKGEGSLLVLTPTRELAQQVNDELARYGKYCLINSMTIQGGESFARQTSQYRRGARIVVATPGRLLDLLKSKKLPNFSPSIVVLDEADEMLDMGFLDDIQAIFAFLPPQRQTLPFSATMPPPIQKLAEKTLKKPVFVKITQNQTSNEDIEQLHYVIRESERDEALIRLIDSHQPQKAIIFCRTKKEVDRLATHLTACRYPARSLHGDMEQPQRQRVISSFRRGEIKILVATDVAARGLNIIDVTHVFNFNVPTESEGYVHRIGRTGRAGRKGVAITLLTLKELAELQRLLKSQGIKVEHRSVPTLDELKKQQALKLLQTLRELPRDPEALPLLVHFEQLMGAREVAISLVSLLLKEQRFSGPEKIGLEEREVERFLHQSKERSFRQRSPRSRPFYPKHRHPIGSKGTRGKG